MGATELILMAYPQMNAGFYYKNFLDTIIFRNISIKFDYKFILFVDFKDEKLKLDSLTALF